jgi:hypothetical protein
MALGPASFPLPSFARLLSPGTFFLLGRYLVPDLVNMDDGVLSDFLSAFESRGGALFAASGSDPLTRWRVPGRDAELVRVAFEALG